MSNIVPFVHLHLHTTYSLLDGACQIKPLVSRVKELGMEACAITDHGNLFGLKAFYDECRKQGIKPILGCEAYVAQRTIHNKTEQIDRSGHHLVLLAKNLTGYHNLLKLISIAHTEGFYHRARIDKELLAKYHEGLICSSACIAGEIPSLILEGKLEEAEKSTLWYKDLFGEDFYLEIMRHKPAPGVLCRKDGEEPLENLQDRANATIMEIASKHGIKVIATNDVHFLLESHDEAHDVLLCLGTGKKLADKDRLRYTRQEWLKSYDEMCANLPGFHEQIHNTVEVAAKVEEYELNSSPILPVFPIPEDFGSEEEYHKIYNEENLREEFGERFEALAEQGIDKLIRIKFEADYLYKLCYDGAAKRWPAGITDEIRERIEFEFNTIKTMGFPGYFLIVQDYIAAARNMGVSVGPGRGSGAGSIVAYCLGITNIDPMKYDLLFERFLNPDRISMPDFDVDFDDEGRGRVLEYVTNKYGVEHVAHIVTFGQMAPKSAIKDVCRVMDIPLAESNRLAALIPETPKITFPKAIKANPELEKEFNSDDPQIRKALELARILDGTIRQPGVHACGVIISRDPLIDTIPVIPTEGESLLTTQYDGHFVEPIGLLKMDFLGLKTLTVLKGCISNIKEDYGIDINPDEIPLDDKETYALFSRGETTGLFQFESGGMKKYLRELKPTCLEDLVAMNALYRPGPMQYIPQFIRRKHGQEAIVYDHPLMEKYLSSTYGVCVYQEQVMLLSRLLGGFTRGESDSLRKAMGKKLKDVMDKLLDKFQTGCLNNKEFCKGTTTVLLPKRDEKGEIIRNPDGSVKAYEEKPLYLDKPEDVKLLVGKIWSDWEAFASYAFNKSHAVCYAYVAYQTGYLKAHYKAEFMCAQMDSEIGNFDKLPGLVAECADLGLKVLPPDVNFSLARFSPGDNAVRFGLAGIKGVGAAASAAIVEERKKNGIYKSFIEFCERVDPVAVSRRDMESLIKAGAFDCFNIHRARLLNGLEKAFSYAATTRADKQAGQGNLFATFGVEEEIKYTDEQLPQCEEWKQREALQMERELVGMYLSGDPLREYRIFMDALGTTTIGKALAYRGGENEKLEVRLCGIVTSIQIKKTREKQEDMAIVTIEDGGDHMEAVLFPKSYRFGHNAKSLQLDELMVFCGDLSFKDGKVTLLANEVFKLPDAVNNFIDKAIFNLPYSEDFELVEKIHRLISSNTGYLPITLHMKDSRDNTIVIEVPSEFKIMPNFAFVEDVREKLGPKVIQFSAKGTIYSEYKPRRWVPKN